MYSPQLIRVECTSGDAASLHVSVLIVNDSTGRDYTETREFHGGIVRFNIERIMQLLAPDVDLLFHRIDHNAGRSLSEGFSIYIAYEDIDGITYPILSLPNSVTALYGALDAGEIYGEHSQRRLWVNFPQTFNLWEDAMGDTAFVLDDAYIYPDTNGAGPCYECSFMNTLSAVGESDLIKALKNGATLRNLGLSWRSRIEDSNEIEEELRTITLIPDCSRRTDGTYLRWLNRRGEMSYWLFTNSKLRVTTAVADSFSRYYQGDPTAPVGSIFQNPQKASYREAREMVLGAVGLSRDEFDDLCDLATSPLVERLMPDVLPEDTEVDLVYDGGNAGTRDADVLIESVAGLDTEVGGGNASTGTKTQENKWQRVNVVAGTFERGIKRTTPSRQDLEIIIELPERNTIKL